MQISTTVLGALLLPIIRTATMALERRANTQNVDEALEVIGVAHVLYSKLENLAYGVPALSADFTTRDEYVSKLNQEIIQVRCGINRNRRPYRQVSGSNLVEA